MRVRTKVLPLLEAELGPGWRRRSRARPTCCGRTRSTSTRWPTQRWTRPWSRRADAGGLSVPALEQLPGAIRSRVLRLAAVRAGALRRSSSTPMSSRSTSWSATGTARSGSSSPATSGPFAARDLLPFEPKSDDRNVPDVVPAPRPGRVSGDPDTSGLIRRGRWRGGGGWSRGRGRCRAGVPMKAPATGWTITSSTSYDEARSAIASAAESGVPSTQRRRIASSRPTWASATGSFSASSTSRWARSWPPVRSATIASSCGRASRSASSWVSATAALTVRKVRGSASASEGRNCDR